MSILSTKRTVRRLFVGPWDGVELAAVNIDKKEVHRCSEEYTLQYGKRGSWHHYQCSERLNDSIETKEFYLHYHIYLAYCQSWV